MRTHFIVRILQTLCLLVAASRAETIVISIPEQRLYVFDPAGENTASYRVSTSKFGVGDSPGSYSTPLGQMVIASKIGDGAPVGTVFKSCSRTGEICKVNARGRDPIVTRILWLRGLEKQNAGAFGRHIYIHGTPDEMHIGRPVSYGCIRMNSKDVIELFDSVGTGTHVEITDEHVSRGFFAKVTRPPEQIAAGPAAKTEPKITEQPKLVATNFPTPLSSTPLPAPEKRAQSHYGKSTASANVAESQDRSGVTLMKTSVLSITFGAPPDTGDRTR